MVPLLHHHIIANICRSFSPDIEKPSIVTIRIFVEPKPIYQLAPEESHYY